jgi:hypothetical protein
MTNGPFGRRSGPVEPGGDAPPEPAGAPRPVPPRAGSSVTWILGVAVVLFLAYVAINTISTDSRGSRGVPKGEPLPEFAAPLVTGALEGDAQVDPEKACGVTGQDVLNSCQLRARGPSVLAFLASRGDECVAEIDVVDRLSARHPGVQFAAGAIRGDRDELRDIVREHGWSIPVAHDRDGAVANLYAVAVCPTITFADAAGQVAATTYGAIGEAELERQITAISDG